MIACRRRLGRSPLRVARYLVICRATSPMIITTVTKISACSLVNASVTQIASNTKPSIIIGTLRCMRRRRGCSEQSVTLIATAPMTPIA